jgi:2-hydroxychromene-2-carboxylate isomerase
LKAIDFWFDPVSPFAYLAFERLPELLAGTSYTVAYRPIVFGALLKHFDHKGPAEIEPKRAWTFRYVHWLAQREGVLLTTPQRHPFNSLALSRLAWACAPEGRTPGRYICEAILRHVWQGDGADAEDDSRFSALRERLQQRRDSTGTEVKQALRGATDDALARGVFGVPTIGIDDKLFWGFDGLAMAADCVRGAGWFGEAHWQREGAPRPGTRRA